jgi:hypothetical protein
MQDKIEGLCNQENKISTLNSLMFYPFGRGVACFFESGGCTKFKIKIKKKKNLGGYNFKEF